VDLWSLLKLVNTEIYSNFKMFISWLALFACLHDSPVNTKLRVSTNLIKQNSRRFPGGILRKIQDTFALLRPPSESWDTHNTGSGQSPGRKRVLVHLELEKTHLMVINFVFLQRIFIHIFIRLTTFQTTWNSLTFPVEASKHYPVSSVYRYGQQSLFHINEKHGEAR